jgi:hypothetical protein
MTDRYITTQLIVVGLAENKSADRCYTGNQPEIQGSIDRCLIFVIATLYKKKPAGAGASTGFWMCEI